MRKWLAANSKRKYLVLFGVAGVVVLSSVLWQLIRSHKPMAAVSGSVQISQADYNQQLKQTTHFFTSNNQTVSDATLKKDTLNQLVDLALVEQYAKEHAITVTDQEVAQEYERILKTSKLSEAAYLAKIKAMYGIGKEEHLEKVREELLKEKVQAAVKQPLTAWLKTQRREHPVQTVQE